MKRVFMVVSLLFFSWYGYAFDINLSDIQCDVGVVKPNLQDFVLEPFELSAQSDLIFGTIGRDLTGFDRDYSVEVSVYEQDKKNGLLIGFFQSAIHQPFSDNDTQIISVEAVPLPGVPLILSFKVPDKNLYLTVQCYNDRNESPASQALETDNLL